jgi:hypothetical protein
VPIRTPCEACARRGGFCVPRPTTPQRTPTCFSVRSQRFVGVARRIHANDFKVHNVDQPRVGPSAIRTYVQQLGTRDDSDRLTVVEDQCDFVTRAREDGERIGHSVRD